MEPIYKRLMKQHGGSVPFPLIIRAQKKLGEDNKGKKRKTKHKIRYKQLGGKASYHPGTIIRHNRKLYELNSTKEWVRV
tara:strand:+ start:2636 stop:2872 length:237 start_codon:yes stop_codon:yes gene_type:complete